MQKNPVKRPTMYTCNTPPARWFILMCANFILCLTVIQGSAQTPSTLPRLPEPPDVTERYIPNPKFYEVMMAFPHTNSYVRYDFKEVRAAARKDPAMMVILGDHYRIGRSTQMDLRQALREYQRAAARGSAMAYHRIAYMYADGLGLPKDHDKIMEYLRLGADGGDMLAQYDYALVFLNGKFKEARDLRKAYHYLQLASEQGHKLSTELLAMLAYHQGAPNAGIPYGFANAVELYRKAGDTDGERQLRENTGNWSGLRYYMRTLPGFLPGVDASLDPRKPEEAIALIKQLDSIQHIIGEEQFLQCVDEIVQNMLYYSYFESQNNRFKLLQFLVFCYNNQKWTAPYLEKYTQAAARDFRLMVSFQNIPTLEPYLNEFATYSRLFRKEDMAVVADRIFVSLLFKELDSETQQAVLDYLRQEAWIIHNLTARYILYYEDLLFKGYKNNLIEAPYQNAEVIDQFFDRYAKYNAHERDTLNTQIIHAVRLHAIHPHLSGKMISSIDGLSDAPAPLTTIARMLTASAALYQRDINDYFSTLRMDPEEFLGNQIPHSSIRDVVDRVYTIIISAGQQHLNTLCRQNANSPERMLNALEEYRNRFMPELTLAHNNDRRLLMEAGAMGGLISVKLLNAMDPNQVKINLIVNRELSGRTPACHGMQEGYYLSVPYGTEPYSTLELTLNCRFPDETEAILYLLPPGHPVIRSGFFPDEEHELKQVLQASGTLSNHQDNHFTFSMEESVAHEKLVPVIRIEGRQFAVFPLDT